MIPSAAGPGVRVSPPRFRPHAGALSPLGWLFVVPPLLVTVEPHQVKTWTCCEMPATEEELPSGRGEIAEARLDLTASLSPSEQAAHALHWVRLASGDFYRQFPDRFRRDERADRLLLEGLKYVRKRLQKEGLDDDRIHDLLVGSCLVNSFSTAKIRTAGRRPTRVSCRGCTKMGTLWQEHPGVEFDPGPSARKPTCFFRPLNEISTATSSPAKDTRRKIARRSGRRKWRPSKPPHLKTLAIS